MTNDMLMFRVEEVQGWRRCRGIKEVQGVKEVEELKEGEEVEEMDGMDEVEEVEGDQWCVQQCPRATPRWSHTTNSSLLTFIRER